ncbi:MAG: carbamoyl-phosphate synthase large subunit [Acidimicrobiales bacterium]|jgi:carbamoyl-phosphate synthase large subunit|nr:carbamoyl-phosphate synthase large subunit [Acidimicrobiales bacterium]HJM28876.1 carbamoyl-phosphate synthase large subunit [Acidimicrobiales bacterium]HJM97888.1 carbamoyl-phosphate synthase large subunit [Acidimicrobiales bacterium]
MPKRNDIKKVLLIGSGPIVIGQACEFDYSGTQACRVLKEEGYEVVLANSNPATIMTDPDFADATYIEPLSAPVLTEIIAQENPDALLPTLGGQTALNLAMELEQEGVLQKYGVELIGADAKAIATAEDRAKFKEAMIEIGLSVPTSGVAHSMDEAEGIVKNIGLPVIVRPAYILGGKGTGIAENSEEFTRLASNGLAASPINEILIEQSIKGWKEYELEVMRDKADNCVVVCTIENFDPMGVHTGDSITVAPSQTLSDVEYQQLRDAAFACMRRVGVETGGSNVQFAVNPENGEFVIIEMNPRVSRSSALASKATGFPIAKIATKLAMGYTLDEIPNDITKKTPASFEPTIDYVVTKIPRWAFEKFPGTKAVLGTQMQSVGEVMSIGRTFPESLQKGLRSLELGRDGLNADIGEKDFANFNDTDLLSAVMTPTPARIFQIGELLYRGVKVEKIHEATLIDPWFIDQLEIIVEERRFLETVNHESITNKDLRRAKRIGFSDNQLSYLWGVSSDEVRKRRTDSGIIPVFKTVDTCSAEFEANTPYHYSTYEDTCEVTKSEKPKVIILGSGPNRIGQGIEFDYCCVHASFALSEIGYETIMINCNPETVSTDYDTSDRLFFEPLTEEDVKNVLDVEKESAKAANGPGIAGVIVSLGGQTPLKLASSLPPELISGTPPDSIDLAEDRERWNSVCNQLEIPQPPGGTAVTFEDAVAVVERVGYPVLIRPSYVLGGRAMSIVYDKEQLEDAMYELSSEGSLGKEGGLSSERPVLIDRFLEDATEVDVDAIRDVNGEVLIGGIMEHVEEAGVHSGDSACMTPPVSLSTTTIATLEEYATLIADRLAVIGLVNIQFVVKKIGNSETVFVIEANPRASRTVPFISKAIGVPLVKVAARVMLGETLSDLRENGMLVGSKPHSHTAVKEAVLPFNRFPETDAILGPEMRSTGEVMGIDITPGLAFVKSQIAAGMSLPENGTVFLSVADRDKEIGVETAKLLTQLGFTIAATSGTAAVLSENKIEVTDVVAKLGDKSGITALELIESGKVGLVINSPRGRGPRADGAHIRKAAGERGVPLLTTASSGLALAKGLVDWRTHPLKVRPLQHFHYSQSLKQSKLDFD